MKYETPICEMVRISEKDIIRCSSGDAPMVDNWGWTDIDGNEGDGDVIIPSNP